MSDLDAALADVRRAYRLAHVFQRRVNDLYAHAIGRLQDEAGLRVVSWYPLGSTLPGRRGALFYERWAWDLLSGAQLGVHLEGAVPGRSERAVTLHLQMVVDTAREAWSEGGEPDASRFTSVTESRSVLRWSVAAHPAGTPGNVAYDAVRELPEVDGVSRRAESPVGAVAVTGWELDLSALPDRDAVDRLVVLPTLEAIRAG